MYETESAEKPGTKPAATGSAGKTIIKLLLFILILEGVFYLTSGKIDWVMGWILIGTYLFCLAINALVLLKTNPELLAERTQYQFHHIGWDKKVVTGLGIFWAIGFILPGLDYRYGWSPEIDFAPRIIALLIMMLGNFIFLWAMSVNKFFTHAVCIQKEMGHTAITTGPYRYVRHPGYVGWILTNIAPAVILGSLWALIPMGLAAFMMIVRTALEDRMLRRELEGYEEYAARVRYRLLPGVW